MENTLALYALGFAAVSSLAALATAVLIYLQVRAANKQNLISVFLKYQDRFSEEGMSRAIRLLYQFRTDHGEDCVAQFQAHHHDSSSDIGDEVNEARRRVSNYYVSLSNALKAGALSEELARTVTTSASTSAFYEICIPMNEGIYGKPWGKKHVDRIKALRNGDKQ